MVRDSLLSGLIIDCDETRFQVLKEPDRDSDSQPWLWVKTGGLPDRPVILVDSSTSGAQEVTTRRLGGCRG
ncbi:IS66 family transposase [Pseudomonas sp. SWRI56]|nr:IS66 family transposase [Pseudomonas shirazensis]